MAVFEEKRQKHLLIAQEQRHKHARKGVQGELKDEFNNTY